MVWWPNLTLPAQDNGAIEERALPLRSIHQNNSLRLCATNRKMAQIIPCAFRYQPQNACHTPSARGRLFFEGTEGDSWPANAICYASSAYQTEQKEMGR